MKTRIFTLILLITFYTNAQRGGSIFSTETAIELHKIYTKMLEIAALDKPSGLTCLPEEFYKSIDKKFEKESLRRATDLMSVGLLLYSPGKMEYPYELGSYQSFQDKAVDALQNSTDFFDFLRKATGTSADLHSEDERKLRKFYDTFNRDIPEFHIYSENFILKNGCKLKLELYYSASNYKFPDIDWNFKQKLKVSCPCNDPKSINNLKSANYEVTGVVKGKHTEASAYFNTPTSATLKIIDAACCAEIDQEETALEIKEDDLFSLPNQSLGITAGVGFANDFDETNICLGAEYLFNVMDVGNSSLFVGANVFVENNSFNDFNNTIVGAGPTAQLFTPINPARDVHMTNGISADLLFGTNDNNGIKDDIFGFNINVNTGLNVRINEDISLMVKVPIVTFTNLEFTSQDGDVTFKSNSTDIFLFKNSPVKFGVRFDLVD